MAAVADDGELDTGGPAVVEERVDRGPDRPPGVEDVVDEDAGAALEREVDPRRADERLRVQRRVAAADLDVVSVEGDVDGAEREVGAGELLDQPPQALGQEDAARVDPDQRDLVEAARCASMISWAMRWRVRWSASASRSTRSPAGALAAMLIRLLSGLAGPG